MKYMFASDIHGSAYYCDMLMERFKSENPYKLILLGDILYHGPRNDLPRGYAPKSVIESLNAVADKIIAVRGNCDAEVDQMVLNFEIMRTYRVLDIDGIHFFITHGHIFNKEKPFQQDEKYVLMNGHFHVPEITDMPEFIYINDGSVSIPKENSENSYGVLEGKVFELKNLEGKVFEQTDLNNM